MAKSFKGRKVAKEVVNLGIGGTIERPEGLERPVRVKFEAYADMAAIKHKFEKDGTVTESSILTIDASTFAILSVEDLPEPEPQLPGVEEDGD